MRAYLDIVKNVLENGEKVSTRQGLTAYTIAGAIFEHDMSKGFPLLTTKKMPFRLISTELEFFINGITDKQWLLDRNNHIWDEWASPKKAPYGHDEASKKRMLEERELGPIYGFQWRHFNAKYENYNTYYTNKKISRNTEDKPARQKNDCECVESTPVRRNGTSSLSLFFSSYYYK